MSKKLLKSALTFTKNVGRHAQLLVKREETPGEAWAHLAKDARKLKYVATKPAETPEQREVAQLIRRGKRAYNARDYEKAEAFFRQAIVTDSECCQALTYLGHTLYKQGRISEAENSWSRAVEVAPTYEAAEKAREKLLVLEKKKKQTVAELEDRIRDRES